MNGNRPFSFLPLPFGQKDHSIPSCGDSIQHQNRTCRYQSVIILSHFEFGRTAACRSDYEVDCDGNEGTTNRRRTAKPTKWNMYEANMKPSEQYLLVTFRVWQTAACRSNYEVDSNGTAGRRNEWTKNRRWTMKPTKLNMYEANYQLHSEFGRTAVCQSDYEVDNDGTAGCRNEGTTNRRRTTTRRVGEAYVVQYGNSL